MEAISQAREYCDATGVYTDGSMSEDGIVGAGWYLEGAGGVIPQGGKGVGEMILRKLATVWDGEVCGVRGALEDAPSESIVLTMSDSQVAIAAVRKAGRTGGARTADLRRVMMDIKETGTKCSTLRVVKAHNDVCGNEKADQLAKHATTLYPEEPQITEGG